MLAGKYSWGNIAVVGTSKHLDIIEVTVNPGGMMVSSDVDTVWSMKEGSAHLTMRAYGCTIGRTILTCPSLPMVLAHPGHVIVENKSNKVAVLRVGQVY